MILGVGSSSPYAKKKSFPREVKNKTTRGLNFFLPMKK